MTSIPAHHLDPDDVADKVIPKKADIQVIAAPGYDDGLYGREPLYSFGIMPRGLMEPDDDAISPGDVASYHDAHRCNSCHRGPFILTNGRCRSCIR